MSISGWEKTEEVNVVRYKFLSQEKPLKEVEINSKYGMDTIILKGECTEEMYALMKEKLEQRFTEECFGNISLSDKNIWICVREIYLANEAELGPVLDKVYKVVESLFPQFSQIIKEIDSTIVVLGNKKGLDYFNQKKTAPIEKLNEKNLVPIEEFDKFIPENGWKKIEADDVVRYQLSSKEGLLSEVEINSVKGADTIIFKGEGTAKIYELIEKGIDKRYTSCLGSIDLINKKIWIHVKNIHSENETELRSVLDKVYSIVESLFPQFSQITKEIDSTIVVLGNKKGLDYFNQKKPILMEKLNEKTLIPAGFDKLIPENCWKKIEEINSVKYQFIFQDGPLNEVEILNEYCMDRIILRGRDAEKIYALIEKDLDKRYTNCLGPIKSVNKNIWICISNIHSKDKPELLRSVLDKVYNIVESLFPQFSQITKEIDSVIVVLGNKKGLDYFNQKKIAPIEKINQKILISKEFDKAILENSWKKIEEREDVIRYRFLSKEGSLREVEISEEWDGHEIVLKGPNTAKVYRLIEKSDIDKRHVEEFGNISFFNENISISLGAIHRENEAGLRPILDTIYKIIESLFPQFSQIKKEIDSTIITLGKKKGLDYFDLDCFSEMRKKFWRNYIEDKVRRFTTPARPNPLPCTGCWGVEERSNRLSEAELKEIQETISKLKKITDKPKLEYEGGDWANWSSYPEKQWSTEANFVRKKWGPIFLKQDQRSDDIHHGFVSPSQPDKVVERIMGFSCEDLNNPLSSVYFIKQRRGEESIAMTLFAKEGKIKEFEEWLRNIGVIPVVQPPFRSYDEYMSSDCLDPAYLYEPAAFYDSQKGIFGSLIAKDIECLRRILTEHHYQIESSFFYAFNNICNSQTGCSKFIFPNKQ